MIFVAFDRARYDLMQVQSISRILETDTINDLGEPARIAYVTFSMKNGDKESVSLSEETSQNLLNPDFVDEFSETADRTHHRLIQAYENSRNPKN